MHTSHRSLPSPFPHTHVCTDTRIRNKIESNDCQLNPHVYLHREEVVLCNRCHVVTMSRCRDTRPRAEERRGEVVTWERECANLCHVLRIHDCHDRYPPYHCRYDDRAGHCVDVSRSRVFTVSLYRVWIVCGLCGDVGGGEIQVRLPAPGLRLSSPTAALQPLPVPPPACTGQRNSPPPSYLLTTTGWAWAVSALPSQVALSFVLCIRINIITSSVPRHS